MYLFEDMEFLRRSSDICLFLAGAVFLLAVVLFFALDIRRAFLIETGMAERMDSKRVKNLADARFFTPVPVPRGVPGTCDPSEKSPARISPKGAALRAAFSERMNMQKQETGERKPPEKRIDRDTLKKEFKVTRKIIVVHTTEPATETIEMERAGFADISQWRQAEYEKEKKGSFQIIQNNQNTQIIQNRKKSDVHGGARARE